MANYLLPARPLGAPSDLRLRASARRSFETLPPAISTHGGPSDLRPRPSRAGHLVPTRRRRPSGSSLPALAFRVQPSGPGLPVPACRLRATARRVYEELPPAGPTVGDPLTHGPGHPTPAIRRGLPPADVSAYCVPPTRHLWGPATRGADPSAPVSRPQPSGSRLPAPDPRSRPSGLSVPALRPPGPPAQRTGPPAQRTGPPASAYRPSGCGLPPSNFLANYRLPTRLSGRPLTLRPDHFGFGLPAPAFPLRLFGIGLPAADFLVNYFHPTRPSRRPPTSGAGPPAPAPRFRATAHRFFGRP